MAGATREPRPPSIHDVARVAGVSYQTVSRVINSSPLVSEKSRLAVTDAIAELDFHPSSAARAFATGRGRDIAVVSSDLESYGWTAMLAGIHRRARERDRSIVLHELRTVDETAAWLKSQTVHATLVLGGSPTSHAFVEASTPGRVIGVGDRPIPGHSWLTFTEYDGAVAATRHLLDLGHRVVHHVTSAQLRGTSREDGWRDTVPGGDRPPVVEIGVAPAAAFTAGTQLGERRDVSAVFCANDEIAIPLIAGLRAAGRAVPADVSVVGFDDHPLAAYVDPPLTTVRQDFRAIGQRAVDLAETIDGIEVHDAVHLPATFVARGTTHAAHGQRLSRAGRTASTASVKAGGPHGTRTGST